jgi:glucuronokinase
VPITDAIGPVAGFAPARTALAGNPSDGYGGAVLSVALPQFGARAVARAGSQLEITPPSRLVEATALKFARELAPAAASSAIEWTTTVPERVGLGGSSAIVIACLRALCALHRVELGRDRVAAFALAVEREDLRIPGGRQDQTVESYGGLMLMDFGTGIHEQLDPRLLAPLVIAWHEEYAESSGIVHTDLRARWTSGERIVREMMKELAALAHEAGRAVTASDRKTFARCVDRSFDLRAQLLELEPRHVAMVTVARAAGAAANYSGSGGAVVAVCDGQPHRERVLAALCEHGCRVLAPEFSPRDAVVGG